MLIGEVARRSGVSVHAIRYYEQEHLLAPTARSACGYRLYSDRVLSELAFLKQAQRLGFSLGEISEILQLGRAGRKPCANVSAICEKHLVEIDKRMSELRAFRKSLQSAKRLADAECGLTAEGFCRAVVNAR